MASIALGRWRTIRGGSLDEIEAAHRSVGGSNRGRRFATEQINHAYAVLLSSQFQGFCRDLHTEVIDYFLPEDLPVRSRVALRSALATNRKLDRGNPNPSNIQQDFRTFGIALLDEVQALDPNHRNRLRALDHPMLWRNAIAHQDFGDANLGSSRLRLDQVRRWRRACDALVEAFDEVMGDYIHLLMNKRPW